MNPKNQPKPNRRAAFLNAWKQAFRLDLLSQKGIEKLLELKEQYSLSYDDVQDLTGMPKSSLQRQKNKTPDQKTKPGPKFKLSLDKKDLIFKNLSDMRSENKIVQILDLQKQADIVVGFSNETSKKDKHFISPSTASRLFKEHKWTYRRTQNRLLASEPKERDAFIKNFLKKVQLFITALKIKPDNFYVMDESGIHTNLARKYTFTPINDKNVYVRVPNDSTKDTIIVTLSASGGGHLYYVPFFPQTSEHRAIKGVGKDQILDWGRAFIGRTQKQNGLLLLDNLNSHKDENLLEYLRLNNIFVLPFPVRCADKLSVLDNSFLRSYKANLSLLFSELAELKGDDLKNRKRENNMTYKETLDAIMQKTATANDSYFIHDDEDADDIPPSDNRANGSQKTSAATATKGGGKTPVTDKFSTDLTQAALEGKLDPTDPLDTPGHEGDPDYPTIPITPPYNPIIDPPLIVEAIMDDWFSTLNLTHTESGVANYEIVDGDAEEEYEDSFTLTYSSSVSRTRNAPGYTISFKENMPTLVAINMCSLLDDAFVFFADNNGSNTMYYVHYGDDLPLASNPGDPNNDGVVNVYPRMDSQYQTYTKFDLMMFKKLVGVSSKNSEGSETIVNNQIVIMDGGKGESQSVDSNRMYGD